MVIGVIAHESGGASWPMSHRRSMDDRHQRHGTPFGVIARMHWCG